MLPWLKITSITRPKYCVILLSIVSWSHKIMIHANKHYCQSILKFWILGLEILTLDAISKSESIKCVEDGTGLFAAVDKALISPCMSWKAHRFPKPAVGINSDRQMPGQKVFFQYFEKQWNFIALSSRLIMKHIYALTKVRGEHFLMHRCCLATHLMPISFKFYWV